MYTNSEGLQLDRKSSTRIHATLRPRTSLFGALGAAAVAVILTLPFRPVPWLMFAVAASCGVVAALLQSAALRQAPQALADARDALEIRRVMMSTVGRWAIVLQWAMAAVLLVVWVAGGMQPFLAPITAFALFLFVRELLGLPQLFAFASEYGGAR